MVQEYALFGLGNPLLDIQAATFPPPLNCPNLASGADILEKYHTGNG
jgi:hypothetical protein